MKKAIFLFLFFQCYIYSNAVAQMWNENQQDTLYGNEWIDFEHADRYFKIKITKDGIHRVNQTSLVAANIPVQNIENQQYQIFRYGEEVPLYVSSANQNLGNDDYIEFYGQKNRSEIDRHLFKNPNSEMLNPEYSLFTDTTIYFLTWTEVGEGLRYETVENDLSGNLPATEEWFIEQQLVNYPFVWFKKYQKISGQDVYYSHFDEAEGFATARSVDRTENINAAHVHPNSTTAKLAIRLATNVGLHQLQIDVNNNNYVDDSFSGLQLRQYELDIPLTADDTDLQINIKGIENNSDQHVLSNIVLNYQRQFNFDGQNSYIFTLSASNEAKYLEIENFNSNLLSPILYDVSNHIRLQTETENGLVKVVLPPSTIDRQLILTNHEVNTIQDVEQNTFIDYRESNANYVLLSHSAFFDDGQGNNLVQEYANYRSSSQGGNYETLIVDIEQLYDQFAYGLYAHSISVRNFSHFIKKNWDNSHYFVLLGKGREYPNIRTTAQFQAAHNSTFFVPTFGWPGADNLLFSNNNSNLPIFSIGRIACNNTAELKIYLNKVKDFEANVNNVQTVEAKAWMKNIIHLGGGGSAVEQSLIEHHLEAFGDIIEDGKFGGQVSSFYKTSSDPIQTAVSDQVFDRINKGTSLITFFGHSSNTGLSFNIDNPDNYDNQNKYPFMYALGCGAGNYFINGTSASEQFIFLEDKGTIVFGASVGFGFVSSLRRMMDEFYTLIGNDLYGQSIGDIMQQTYKNLDHATFIGDVTLTQQFSFHADPALKAHAAPGPDYTIDNNSVNFEPKIVTLNQDSFQLNFEVFNLGQNIEDSITVEIVQELPNQERILIKKDTIKTPAYAKQLSYTLPTLGKSSVGLNKFYIEIDKENEVEELPLAAEFNNELIGTNGILGTTLYVVDNSATPIFPPNYGIVHQTDLELKASTADALAPERKYLIELDTSRLFNSPSKQKTEIIQKGGLIKWQPNTNYTENTTYYWRISPDSTDANIGYLWEYSSFLYLENGSNGWSQNHYFQFTENESGNIKLNEATRNFEFADNFTHFRIKNSINTQNGAASGFVNNARWSDFFRWYLPQSVQIVVFDNYGKIWFNPSPGLYGSSTNVKIGCFSFPVETTEERSHIINFINDVIPDNHTVFVYTAQRTISHDLNIESWEQDSITLNGKNIFNTLENQGATRVRELKNGTVPYLYAFIKNGATIGEVKAESLDDVFNFEHSVPGFWHEGRIQSSLIGPAKSWENLQINYEDIALESADSIAVNLYGISKNKDTKTLLLERISVKDTTLNFIDPVAYPYLQLEYYATDDEEYNVSQLDFWRIMYQGFPDAAVNTSEKFVFYQDTIQQGDILKVNVLLGSTAEIAMDSLLIKYWIIDEQRQEITQYKRLAPLSTSEELFTDIRLETKDLSGLYQFWLEINPNEDQDELYDFNNYLVKSFFVEKDKRNPLLDVTFDGTHIINGDIIATEPIIQITLKDENQFLLLQDTSLFDITLTAPNGEVTRFAISDPMLQFTPASSSANNKASIEFRPVFEATGDYKLSVTAKDVTNNAAGDLNYEIEFQVILEKMVSNVLNYPNPFSTSTRFVYTLTGDRPPAYMSIQILTVSGQVVREITQHELGELKIGRHQTDFAWNGTDEFGDQLANGVYLYRVIVKDENGADYDKFDTGTDQFFRNGIGKLVILR